MAYPYNTYTPYSAPYQMQPYMAAQPPQMSQQMQMPIQAAPVAQQAAQQAGQGISSVSRPVTSKEEAIAAQIPFDGSVSVFTDIPHGKIYTKTFNFNDGTAIFNTFVREVEQPTQEPAQTSAQAQAANYATVDDLSDLQSRIESLQAEIDRLKRPAGRTAKRNESSDE